MFYYPQEHHQGGKSPLKKTPLSHDLNIKTLRSQPLTYHLRVIGPEADCLKNMMIFMVSKDV